MKPSEYLLKPNGKYNLFSYHNMNLIDNIDDYNNPKHSEQEYDDACKYKDKLLEDIDKQFIDREELKEKINNEFELHRTIFKCKAIFTEKGFNNLKKEILELLK